MCTIDPNHELTIPESTYCSNCSRNQVGKSGSGNKFHAESNLSDLKVVMEVPPHNIDNPIDLRIEYALVLY